MYPNAREHIGTNTLILTQPLGKIIERVADAISQTQVAQAAIEVSQSLSSNAVTDMKNGLAEYFFLLLPIANERQIGQWNERIQQVLVEQRTLVPRSFLDLNQIIHTSVSVMMSLAVWRETTYP